MGYSPWNHRESDTTEHAHMHVKSQVLCEETKLERVNQLHNDEGQNWDLNPGLFGVQAHGFRS